MAASSSSASTGLSMRLISPLVSRSTIHSRRSRQVTGRAALEPTLTPARSIACSSMPRSEVRLRRARDREQTLIEVILVVLGADCLDQRIGDLAPALDQIERLVERVGVVDLDERLDPVAVGRELDALGDVQLLGERRAEIIDVAVLGLQPDGVDEQRIAVLVAADRIAEP